jgi:hypothetical protein
MLELKIKCVKSVCELDQTPGLMQVFYSKNGSIRSARLRHYLGTEAGKPKFSYCNQTVSYAEVEAIRLKPKIFN